MNFHLHSQEIYLLERYTSLDYFGELRDRWELMIKHIETNLEIYMHHLPARYRSQPLSEQPDLAWGSRVLPNFRSTLQCLTEGFIFLSHQDFKGLLSASAVMSDHKGQFDYSTNWMPAEVLSLYQQLLTSAVAAAHNIMITERGGWDPFNLIDYGPERGPLNPPESWPTYHVNRKIRVPSGEKVQRNGIYAPDVENSCAQFLWDRYDSTPEAKVCVGIRNIPHPVTGEKWSEERIFEKSPCTWFLVERTSDEGGSSFMETSKKFDVSRKLSGEICQVSGFYFSPANANSRRFFCENETFPAFDSAYGQTIWQWDQVQENS